MTKKRGNPNWGKPDVNVTGLTGPTSFEEVVKKLELSPADYEHSVQLKDWVRKNKDQKYAPSDLLKAWDLEVPRRLLKARARIVSEQITAFCAVSDEQETNGLRVCFFVSWRAPRLGNDPVSGHLDVSRYLCLG